MNFLALTKAAILFRKSKPRYDNGRKIKPNETDVNIMLEWREKN